ncbi:MAG: hypothetical protein VW879_04520, partial [Opitutae bacterium]
VEVTAGNHSINGDANISHTASNIEVTSGSHSFSLTEGHSASRLRVNIGVHSFSLTRQHAASRVRVNLGTHTSTGGTPVATPGASKLGIGLGIGQTF